jgi:hypothetical protein
MFVLDVNTAFDNVRTLYFLYLALQPILQHLSGIIFQLTTPERDKQNISFQFFEGFTLENDS